MRKPRNSREVAVYSVQGHRLRGMSSSEALAEVRLGNARILRSAPGAGEAIQFLALTRCEPHSPSGMTRREMVLMALGVRAMRDKAAEWQRLQDANFRRLVAAA